MPDEHQRWNSLIHSFYQTLYQAISGISKWDKIPEFHDLHYNVLDLPLVVKGNIYIRIYLFTFYNGRDKKEGILKMCHAI